MRLSSRNNSVRQPSEVGAKAVDDPHEQPLRRLGRILAGRRDFRPKGAGHMQAALREMPAAAVSPTVDLGLEGLGLHHTRSHFIARRADLGSVTILGHLVRLICASRQAHEEVLQRPKGGVRLRRAHKNSAPRRLACVFAYRNGLAITRLKAAQ
jgi:hypothetical protein